jgi:hypothetical protein
MVDILICFISVILVSGYSMLVCLIAMEGCKKWWEPFVYAALTPFALIYAYWKDIAFVILFFSVLIGIPLHL